MATPRIYKQLQAKLTKYFYFFNVANVVFIVMAVLCLVFAPKEADSLPIAAVGFVLFGLLSAVMMVLSMVSTYQQQSMLRSIPIVGRVHKALVRMPTPWAEALHINFMAIICLLFFGVLIVLLYRF
jgi:MFS superfamily sulfate permease-like transporter